MKLTFLSHPTSGACPPPVVSGQTKTLGRSKLNSNCAMRIPPTSLKKDCTSAGPAGTNYFVTLKFVLGNIPQGAIVLAQN